MSPIPCEQSAILYQAIGSNIAGESERIEREPLLACLTDLYLAQAATLYYRTPLGERLKQVGWTFERVMIITVESRHHQAPWARVFQI